MAKITNIDNRSKTIEKPYVYSNKTYGIFLCQYSVFENEVRFEKCTFEKDVVFGDENNDEAFCTIKADLVFDGCIFLNKVKLDGLQCYGHVIFKDCIFEYESVKVDDYSLSLSNAKIGIGINILNTTLSGGINCSATNATLIGCQLSNVTINNDLCDLNFIKAYLGRELSIKNSNIVCNNICLENTAVDPIQGSIQIGGGGFINAIEPETISRKAIKQIFGEDISEFANIYSLFEMLIKKKKYLIIAKEEISLENDNNILIQKIEDLAKERRFDGILLRNRSEIKTEFLVPMGNAVISCDEQLVVFTLFFDDIFYLYDVSNNRENHLSLDDFSRLLFGDIFNSNTSVIFEKSAHKSVPLIRAQSTNKTSHIAIYDQSQNFKIFTWNYIKSNQKLDFNQVFVGCGLYIKQSELNSPGVNMHGLVSKNELLFEDVIFYTSNIDASEINVLNFIFRNIDYRIGEDFSGYWTNNESKEFPGLNLESSIITNRLEISDLFVQCSSKIASFLVNLEFVRVGNLLEFSYYGNDNDTLLKVNQNNAKIENWSIFCFNWNTISLETINCSFKSLKLDGIQVSSASAKDHLWKRLKKSIVEKICAGNVLFLKTIEGIFYKTDNCEWEKIWKYRNNKRIEKEHPFLFPIHILFNKFVVNYGLSARYLIGWLLLMMIAFDLITFKFYNLSGAYCAVNGFVEFLPVSFNSPIMEQLRDSERMNGHAVKEVLSDFKYSALVTGYRVISYTLFSILIASFGGYFKGKNQ